jgi:hypothetical protein
MFISYFTGKQLFSFFILFLNYHTNMNNNINNNNTNYCDNSVHACNRPWTNPSHPVYFYCPSTSPVCFSNSVWWVSLCYFRMYVCSVLYPLHPSASFLFPFPFSQFPIIIITFGLDSINDRKHEIFDLLSLAYLIQHDDLQFHSFSFKWHNVSFLYGWVICHGWVMCHSVYLLYIYIHTHICLYTHMYIYTFFPLSIH